MSDRRLEALLDARPGGDHDVAVYAGGRELTYAQLRAGARDLARRLADEAGVRVGQPVAVRLPDGPELVTALFAVWLAGGVYVPLNPRATDAEVSKVLASVRPAAVVSTDGVERRDDAATHDADVALVSFTSGTTGPPKPVLLRHSGVLDLMEPVLRKLLGDGAESVERRRAPMPNLIPVSLSLWAGIYNVLFAFRVGAPVVLMERFDTKAFAELVARFGIRSTVLPPAAMTMLNDDTGVTSLEPLRFVRTISAPLSPLQARRFRDRFGVTALNCYGQTELGGEIVGWNSKDARAFGESKLGSVGRPHEGVSMRVADDGELLVRTPAMSSGYADGADLGDRLTGDGWFRTGDVGRVDDEGFVWIEGRVSEMINRGGLKVFPTEVEEVLRLSPDVADCAVVGVPDDRLGEVPCAFVVARAGTALDATALEALCREHVAPYKVPTRFVPVDSLPRNDAGKVVRSQLFGRGGSL